MISGIIPSIVPSILINVKKNDKVSLYDYCACVKFKKMTISDKSDVIFQTRLGMREKLINKGNTLT